MASILYNRAKYFYEMASYEFEEHKEPCKKDLDLRLTIGYVIGQSLELVLKQILEDITSDYPETHKLIVVCDVLLKRLNDKRNPPSKLSLVSISKLKNHINTILPNAKIYGDLAYGARYIADITLSYNQLVELIDISEKLLLFYSLMES